MTPLAKSACLTLAALCVSACTASSDAPDLKKDDPVRVGEGLGFGPDDTDVDADSTSEDGLERKREVAEKPPLNDEDVD